MRLVTERRLVMTASTRPGSSTVSVGRMVEK